MELIFEKSREGHGCSILPACDVPVRHVGEAFARRTPPRLPQISESDLSRHYSALARRSFGVNDGFYPLGSCTMKYSPKIDEEAASLPGFAQIHPLQPAETAQGCLKVLKLTEKYLCELTGMSAMTFQPAAGAHGEFTGLLLIKAYHRSRGDVARKKIIVPDSAHGTNPASAAMCGFTVVNIPSGPDGCVDLAALKKAVGPDTAGLMLTNPNTLGLFDKNILGITRIVHEAGGLAYYDGANLNAVVGVARPGDMGFDAVHLNLHKTFSTPHGGGGPGAGAVGCRDFLAPFLPVPLVRETESGLALDFDRPQSIGRVKGFYGNFLVVVRALAYLLTLGRNGLPQVAENAVLNANYLLTRLKSRYPAACPGRCMHEFVLSLAGLKKECGVTAMDIAKAMQDAGMHPPTMYFPQIVEEALMVEPTETESKDTLDRAADVMLALYDKARSDPQALHRAPETTAIGRPDEVRAARHPVVKYNYD